MILQHIIMDSVIGADPEYIKEVGEALKLQGDDWNKIGISFKNTFDVKDLSTVTWNVSNYDPDYWSVSRSWIRRNVRDLGEYHTVVFVIDDSNWNMNGLNESVFGWMMGDYSGKYVQIIRTKKGRRSISALYGNRISSSFAFSEELMHFIPRIIKRELGVDLDVKYGFSVSEQIIHGKSSSYTRWKYVKFLKENKDLLLKVFNDMYELYKDPENPKEVYAIKENFKRHIVNLYTLREGNGIDWSFKEGSIIPNYPKSELNDLEERAEIVFTPKD